MSLIVVELFFTTAAPSLWAWQDAKRICVRMLYNAARCVTGLLKICQFNHKPLGEMKGNRYYNL